MYRTWVVDIHGVTEPLDMKLLAPDSARIPVGIPTGP